jgi:hypothetical protein
VRTAVAPVASALIVMSKRVGCLNDDSVSILGQSERPRIRLTVPSQDSLTAYRPDSHHERLSVMSNKNCCTAASSTRFPVTNSCCTLFPGCSLFGNTTDVKFCWTRGARQATKSTRRRDIRYHGI